MRIGLFTDSYLPTVNGVSFVVDTTRRELQKLGHEVYIFAPAPSLRYQEADIHIIRYRAVRGVGFKENLNSIFYPRNQVKKISRMQLDLVHFFTPSQVGLLGIYSALSQGIPVVGQYCTDVYNYTAYYPSAAHALFWLPAAMPVISKYPFDYWRDVIKKLRRKNVPERWRQRTIAQVMRVVHDQCQLVIAPSPKMVTQLRSFGIRSRIELLPNGVDDLPADPSLTKHFRNRFGINQDDQVVLYVGRLAAEKNLELLIAAFERVAARLPQTKLVLCGDFDYRGELEQLAADSSCADKIIFTGLIDHYNLRAIYELADVFAFPSLTDTQGLVLNEAAYAGLPIVMIDRNISAAAKANQNALFASNNATDFAQKLLRILNNSDLQREMANRGRKLAKLFSAARQTKKLELLYKQAIKADLPKLD